MSLLIIYLKEKEKRKVSKKQMRLKKTREKKVLKMKVTVNSKRDPETIAHLLYIDKKFFPLTKKRKCVTLLRRLLGSGWGAGAKTLHVVVLSMVYLTV